LHHSHNSAKYYGLLNGSYNRFILIKRLKMPAAHAVFVHFLNKKTTIEPIPLMRKKENTVCTLFHLFLLMYRNHTDLSACFMPQEITCNYINYWISIMIRKGKHQMLILNICDNPKLRVRCHFNKTRFTDVLGTAENFEITKELAI